MSEVLSPEKIAELVEATKHGQAPAHEATRAPRRSPKLRPVDFSRPTKFTTDHQRRIARAIETFCQTAVTRLSAELRWPIELETINTVQLTWSGAQSQLPAKSLSLVLEVEPIGTRMLLSVEQSFVLMCVDCLLGGTPDGAPLDRRLSEIDWALARRLLESIVHQLSPVWQDLAGITLEAGELEFESDAAQLATVSEPTFVVAFEARLGGYSSSLALLIPWIAIAPVAARIAGTDGAAEDSAARASGIELAMASAPVTLRAEVASTEMAVEDVLALAPGSVIRLGSRADQGVSLFAENVRIARVHPGSNGPRRAVQIRGIDGGQIQ